MMYTELAQRIRTARLYARVRADQAADEHNPKRCAAYNMASYRLTVALTGLAADTLRAPYTYEVA